MTTISASRKAAWAVLFSVLLSGCLDGLNPRGGPERTVTYEDNGSTSGEAPVDNNSPYVVGDEVTVLDNTEGLARAGHSFLGWNTSSDGDGTGYAPGDTFAMPSSDVTLYAQWSQLKFGVTYAGNGHSGGTAPSDATSPYTPGATVTVAGAGSLTKAGYSFTGWNTAANGSGTSYASASTFTMPSSNVTLYAQWTQITFSVTYAGNDHSGGTVPLDVSSPYTPNETVTVADAGSLTRAGYTFSGWNTAADGSGTSYASAATFTMPSSNVTLFAQWTLTTYSVTYAGNSSSSGTVPTDVSSPYAPGETVTVAGAGSLTRAGYSFAGWNTAADGSGTSHVAAATFTMPSSNVTLHAQWTLITYDVTYAGNGHSGGTAPTDASAPYAPGATVTVVGAGSLTRTGYSFAGWNTAANGSGTSYASASTFTMPSGDVTLYAQWTLITYSVTYAGNSQSGGSAPTDASSPYASGATVTVAGAGSLTRTGYTFSGWNTAADGNGTAHASASTFTMPSGNVTLYAQWTLITYSVTYAGNNNSGGTPPSDASSPYAPGATVTVAGAGVLTRAGYTFDGWNTEADGSGTDYASASTFTMPSSDVTLYARWTLITYSVTYSGNNNTSGSAPTDASSPYAPNETVTVAGAGSLTRTGYTFDGWNSEANGTGTSYASASTFTMPSSDVTLYAQWTLITYSVTYAGNANSGGSAPTDASSPYAPSETVTVAGAGSLTRTGYTFTGWNSEANGTGTPYAPASTFTMPSSDVTLYAQWTLTTYSVTYEGNGSTGGTVPVDGSAPYTPGATVMVLGNSGTLVRLGYEFTGWNTDSSGSGTSYAPGASFALPSSDVVLYAQWAVNRTVTFDANGGTGTMAVQVLAQGFSANLTSNAFTRTSYRFAGWATSPSGAVTYNDAQSFTMGGADVTLYAVWAADDSLLVHYKFDAQSGLDSSGEGNHGTLSNVTYVSDGAGGYAASLNGTSSYIALPNSIVVNNPTFTMMIRFKATPSQSGVLFGYENGPVGTATPDFVPVLAIRSDGKLRGELWIGSQLVVLSPEAVNDGNWHTAYFSATGTSITLYLDGVSVGTNTGAVQHLSMIYNQIGTGRATGRVLMPNATGSLNGWYYFNGLVDDFYFYDTPL